MSSTSIKNKLKKHTKTGKFYNPDTMLVFNSSDKNRLVVGRLDNDEFIPLDEEAISLCDEHQIKYDESLVTTEETTEENSNNTNDAGEAADAGGDAGDSKAEEDTDGKNVANGGATAVEPSKASAKNDKKVDTGAQAQVPTKKTSTATSASSASNATSFSSGSSAVVQKIIKDLENFVSEKDNEVNNLTQKLTASEEVNAGLKKELEDTKKKLKGVLAAMQDNL